MNIVYYPDPSLKRSCQAVELADLPSLADLAKEMSDIMIQNGGIGLSANQVGLDKRLFVLRLPHGQYKVFVNPVVTRFLGDFVLMTEGCLSLPGIYEEVRRCNKIEVKYLDLSGETKTDVFGGQYAQAIQHEVEHLDGKFFIDNLPRGVLDRIRASVRKAKLAGVYP